MLGNTALPLCNVATWNHKKLMRTILMLSPGECEGIRCRQAATLSKCIGNNHSTIMARRSQPESARSGLIWIRIVRRMVVVLGAESPVKWAFSATHARLERKFADFMAVGAVHREPFSTV